MAVILLNSGKALYITGGIRDTIINLLIEATAGSNHPLTFEEAQNHPELPHPNTYAYYYGCFDQAARVAYQILLQRQTDSEPQSAS